MKLQRYSRQIDFEGVHNFRDLGGYEAPGGRTVVWRRLFRSGELSRITEGDFNRLRTEIQLTSVIDLRSSIEIRQEGHGLLSADGIKCYNLPLIPDGGDREANEARYQGISNMGEFYLRLISQKECGERIIQALEIIADPTNHPLVFHCSVGKDRTGILASFVLGLLRIAEADIVSDYSLTAPYLEVLVKRMQSEPGLAAGVQGLPAFFWEAGPELMAGFLSGLKREYGSARNYLEGQGAPPSLFNRLEQVLLTVA